MKRMMYMIMILSALVCSAQKIGLEEAKRSALEKNYGFAIAEENKIYSELSVRSAFTGFFPAASFTATHTLYTPELEISSLNFISMTSSTAVQEDRTAFSLRITQPVFTGGKIFNGYRIAKISDESASNTLGAEKLKLLADVESRYIGVLETKDLLEVSKESLDLAKRAEETARIKYESGMISKADYLKSSSSRASGDVALTNAEKNYELSKISFSNLTGIGDFELLDIDPEGSGEFIQELSNVSAAEIGNICGDLTKKAVENNPDLKNTALSREIGEKKIQTAKGGFLPTVSLSYSSEWSKTNVTDEYSNSGTVALTASVPILPLYDNYLTVEKSRIDLKKTELLSKQLEDNISAQIKTYLYTLVSASKQFLSSKIAVELAGETYMSVEERANAGLSTEDELNTARLSLVQAKSTLTSSYYSVLRTRTELQKLLGTEDTELIKSCFKNGDINGDIK